MINRFMKILLVGVIFSLFGVFSDWVNVEATSDTEVYADNVLIKAGGRAEIPIYIKNNCGMMAYMLTAEYDSEKIEIENISAGKLSQNGVFDHNLSIHKKNKVDVLWSYTKEITEDGVLFYLQIKAKKDMGKKKTVIKLTYSEEDTFNEKYENAEWKCTPIEICGNNRTVNMPDEVSSKDKRQKSSETQLQKKEQENQTDLQEQESGTRGESREMERETVSEGGTKAEHVVERMENKTAKTDYDKNSEVSEQAEEASPEVISGQSINIDETICKRNQGQVIEKNEVAFKTKSYRDMAVGLGVAVIIVAIVFGVKRKKRKKV